MMNILALAPLQAATTKIDSCSQSDVSAAITAATAGDTILIPRGDCTWTSEIELTTKGVTLRGAGVGQTIIRHNTSTNILFDIDLTAGQIYRITGMTLESKAGSAGRVFRITGAGGVNCRIDHLRINVNYDAGNSQTLFFLDEGAQCLIDHNYIYGSSTPTATLYINGDDDWSITLSPGSADAVYWENNTTKYETFSGGASAMDGKAAGRGVFRYNNVHNQNLTWHGLDTGTGRSFMWGEIYENEFLADSASSQGVNMRGGSGVVFDNVWTGPWSDSKTQIVLLNLFRACCAEFACGNWRDCDEGETCSRKLDGQTDGDGYACRDQPGRGPQQTLQPVYEWNNPVNGVANKNIDVKGGCSSADPPQIVQDRDFYEETQMPGYSAYTFPHPNSGKANGSGGIVWP